MIPLDAIEFAMYEVMKRAATRMPSDIQDALKQAREREDDPLAIAHLEACQENVERARCGQGLVCGDTGFPLYFVEAGAGTVVEGGFGGLWEAAARATQKATEDCFLRPTMVDPLTRNNPGTNCGEGMPKVDLRFNSQGDGLRITGAPKGGGSEIFGTFYRMLYPSDGVEGIKRFVLESVRDGCYAGKICPPAILGVGIGGTADLCMRMAKEAAVLRPVGSRHPDPDVAALEQDLLDASRRLGIGPMGARGRTACLGIHIAKALTHTAALPVAVNAQCLVGRRWSATVDSQGEVTCAE